MEHIRARALLVAVALLVVTGTGQGQEARGSVSGLVTDASGAVVAGAQVTLVNTATGAVHQAATNASGRYSAPYLDPGTYRMTVDKDGFKRVLHESVVVQVADKIALDVRLDPGELKEDVEVVAARPLLDQGSATYGQVVDSTLISQLPLGDGTAYSLTRLVPGTTFEGGYALQRPMDNGNLSGERVGGVARSEFSLDGSSNTANVGGTFVMAISPPSDAIQEFKFETAAFDAQVGHTGAGAVNLALKTGTNDFHGTLSYFNRDESRSANDFASNRTGTPIGQRNYNRFSATVGGPIRKNKTFFMFSYEKLMDDTVEPLNALVPTDRMRQGDFSELGAAIYNPYTAQLVNGIAVRQPFPGNVIPRDLLNPVSLQVLGYYPRPNVAGARVGTPNYFVQQPWNYHYDLQLLRLDHEWSPRHRTYLRGVRNWRTEERFNWAGEQNGIEVTRGFDNRYNYDVALGHTAVLSPSLVLDVKANALMFTADLTPADELPPADLGFSPAAVSVFGDYAFMPRFAVSDVQAIGYTQTAFGAPRTQPYYNYSLNPTLSKVAGNHAIKGGYDFHLLRDNRLDDLYPGGYYTFTGAYVRPTATSPAASYGEALAQFLLGIPSIDANSRIDVAASRALETVQHGFFVQDDWRVSTRLTLNLGLRYDYEKPMTERYNRNTRGFDFATPNPIEDQARLAYARNPIPQVPLDQFHVLGGYLFADDAHRKLWNADTNNFQPRAGFTYKVGEKTLVRGGAGLFVSPFDTAPNVVNQTGFSRSTPIALITPDQLRVLGNLTTPYSGELLQPVGSSLGLRTNLGNNVGSAAAPYVLLDRKNPQYWRYTFGAQRVLSSDVVVEVTYTGQRGQDLALSEAVNAIPRPYLSTSPTRDQTVENFLGGAVPNPFQGLTPDSAGTNGATIARNRLLRPFPEFGDVFVETYAGTSTYDAFLVRLEKRFSRSSTVMLNYTYSRLTELANPLNAGDPPEERRSPFDRPHRLVAAGVLQLPFGKDRRWGTDWGGAKDALLGGWQLAVNYQFQTGEPLTWNNVYWDPACGDPRSLSTRWGTENGKKLGIDAPAWDLSCFYFHDAAVQTGGVDDPVKQRNDPRINVTGNNVRTFPTVLPDFRAQNHNSLDLGLGKTFKLGNRARLEVRAEAINALNYTIFRNTTVDRNPRAATFGYVNNPGQLIVVMRPRDIQLGARLSF